MAGINSENISFSGLKASYVAGNSNNASGNSSLHIINKILKLVYLFSAGFTNNVFHLEIIQYQLFHLEVKHLELGLLFLIQVLQ